MKQTSIFNQLSQESKMIFGHIQKNQTITKKELCSITNNNITTLNRFFQPLEENHLVIESGSADSGGGRRPMLYSVNSKEHYIGAINISSTYYEVAIINFKLEILVVEKNMLSDKDIPDNIIRNIVLIFEKQLTTLGIVKNQIHGVGISIFSSFNRSIGKIGRPINLYLNEKWIDYDLEAKLNKYLNLPIIIENSTSAAAMLEYFHGAGKETSKMMYILCAMNIRATVINQEDLLSDAMFFEDAFGHTTIDFDGEKCSCGSYGCINAYATIPSILKRVETNIKAGRPTILKDINNLTIQEVCKATDVGDTISSEAILSAATMLGIGLSNYINLIRPDIVIIAGILPNISELYYKTCIEIAEQRLNHFIAKDQIEFIRNGHFSAPLVVSAASVMIEHLLK